MRHSLSTFLNNKRENPVTRKQKVKPPQSPTFIAQFVDGQVTRMTTHCENGELDLEHGIAVACAAYKSRTGKSPPLVAAAKFVEPGYTDTVLQEYDAEALEALQAAAQPLPEPATEEAAIPEQVQADEDASSRQTAEAQP
jgi:hypothetical protein